MVGRDLTNRFPPKSNEPSEEEAMRVENFSSTNPRSFQNVGFTRHKGEILGIGGLVGAQRTELVESIFGLRSVASGSIYIEGKKRHIRNAIDAKKQKLALLTEERRVTGIFGVLSVLENTVVANQNSYAVSPLRVLMEKKRMKAADDSTKKLTVKTPNLKTSMKNLSGGNQQKVLIGRWLLTMPEILILDEPTRGIDVGAKYEIYTIINALASQGKSIIMISSEMPELLGMSDRIMVMCEGKVTGIVDRGKADQVEIIRLATNLINL
jgi:methyl-galactoside transport system ATP-binding protein